MDFCQQTAVLLFQTLCVPIFWLGSTVGLVCSIIGAAVEYQRARMRRRREEEEGALPGCMIMMAGALGFMGVVALVVSLFTGQVKRAVLLGTGVGVGFLLGFAFMVGLWLLLMRRGE